MNWKWNQSSYSRSGAWLCVINHVTSRESSRRSIRTHHCLHAHEQLMSYYSAVSSDSKDRKRFIASCHLVFFLPSRTSRTAHHRHTPTNFDRTSRTSAYPRATLPTARYMTKSTCTPLTVPHVCPSFKKIPFQIYSTFSKMYTLASQSYALHRTLGGPKFLHPYVLVENPTSTFSPTFLIISSTLPRRLL